MNSIPIPNNILIPQVEELIKRDKEVIIRAKGNSMLPYIKDGKDSVVLAQPKDLAVGDIVLARVQERFVMHRIISINGNSCTMMGDGNIRGTEVFCREEAIGKVIWIVKPDGRRVAPGKARLWRGLLPIRRYLLALYRRTLLKLY
ncbi:MAG: S24/S26 family peptidase [Candidatus Egerieousia sp.]|nr:S24/S26 family peptidase [Candidatus Egerieousia sp.]